MATESKVPRMNDPVFVGEAIRAQFAAGIPIPPDIPLTKDHRENTDYTVTDAVLDGILVPPTSRNAHIFELLVKHLHAFGREARLSHDEWRTAIDFLTKAGKESTEFQNEFILASDCLGFSALVDEINHPKPAGCTDSCEEGPFWTADAPIYKSGCDLARPNTAGDRMFFSGVVKNTKGEGIKDAKCEVWQADGDGKYDVQYPDRQVGEEYANDRGIILAQPDGSLNYRGILPTAYGIPTNHAAGELLRAMGRHPHRASHLHFIVSAPGYDTLTTALYPSHSPFLGTDPVFATKLSLLSDLVPSISESEWKEMGFDAADVKARSGRVWKWNFEFVLPTPEEVDAERKKQEAAVKVTV